MGSLLAFSFKKLRTLLPSTVHSDPPLYAHSGNTVAERKVPFTSVLLVRDALAQNQRQQLLKFRSFLDLLQAVSDWGNSPREDVGD